LQGYHISRDKIPDSLTGYFYGIFQYLFTTPNPPQNSTTTNEEKYHKIAIKLVGSDKIQKGMFFFPNPD